MVHRLNIQLKHIEQEFRNVDAVLKSLERNANGKLGLSGVTAQCLELKGKKVKVRGPNGEQLCDLNIQKAHLLFFSADDLRHMFHAFWGS